jgi:hypothetical protein
VDRDGRVSALDALNPLRFASQLAVTQNESCPDIGTFVGWYWGDVDCSSRVDSTDGLKRLRYAVGQPVLQTEPCPDIGTQLQ